MLDIKIITLNEEEIVSDCTTCKHKDIDVYDTSSVCYECQTEPFYSKKDVYPKYCRCD